MDKQIEMAIENQAAMRELDSMYTKAGAYDLTMIQHPDHLRMGRLDQPDDLNASCRRAIVEQWGTEAIAILDQLIELRDAARKACPMPLDVAIEVWEKHTILTNRMAVIAEPCLAELDRKNKTILRGIKSNIMKGVEGDAETIAECVNIITRHCPDQINRKSQYAEKYHLYMFYLNCKKTLQRFKDQKAETLQKPVDLKSWIKS